MAFSCGQNVMQTNFACRFREQEPALGSANALNYATFSQPVKNLLSVLGWDSLILGNF
jgi:hypothetical protein